MPTTHRNRFLIALGSNAQSDTRANAELLGTAIERVKGEGVAVLAVSGFYRTPAFPAGSGPDFVNAALLAEAEAGPAGMLALLHRVEAAMGRVRRERWGQRVIDLDLLAMGDAIVPDRATLARWIALPPEEQRRLAPETLILPHPRMQDRGFVLVPLADVAPGWVHPLSGRDVRAMLAALDPAELAAIRRL